MQSNENDQDYQYTFLATNCMCNVKPREVCQMQQRTNNLRIFMKRNFVNSLASAPNLSQVV